MPIGVTKIGIARWHPIPKQPAQFMIDTHFCRQGCSRELVGLAIGRLEKGAATIGQSQAKRWRG